MSTRCTTDLRQAIRMPAAYPVAVYRRGRLLARGRTANASPDGVFIVIDTLADLSPGGQVVLELRLPSASPSVKGPRCGRTVVYLCRIVHARPMGQLAGLGLQFVKKLH